MGGAPAHGQARHDPAQGTADVKIEMGDTFIKADRTKVKAAKVTFAIRNTGQTMHGMAFALQPVKAPGGMLDEAAWRARARSSRAASRRS